RPHPALLAVTRVKPCFQLTVIQIVRQRPGQSGRLGPVEHVDYGAVGHAHAVRNGANGQVLLPPQAKDFLDLAHGQPPLGHRCGAASSVRVVLPRQIRRPPPTPLFCWAAHNTGGWSASIGISGRLRLECVVGFRRNRWSASIGIHGRFGLEYAPHGMKGRPNARHTATIIDTGRGTPGWAPSTSTSPSYAGAATSRVGWSLAAVRRRRCLPSFR